MTESTPQAGLTLPPRGISVQEILSWPPTVDPATAAPAFDLPRSTAYELCKTDRFPCKVIKAGKHWRVITADLIRVLGLDGAPKGQR